MHTSDWCSYSQVAGIFHDASIGNAIHIILVRLILLQGEEVILSLSIQVCNERSRCTIAKHLHKVRVELDLLLQLEPL